MRGPGGMSAAGPRRQWLRRVSVLLSVLLAGCAPGGIPLQPSSCVPSAEASPASPSDAPRTLPEAVCQYLRSLHEPLRAAKDKDNGDGTHDEEAPKNPKATEANGKQPDPGRKQAPELKDNPEQDMTAAEEKEAAEAGEKGNDNQDLANAANEKEKNPAWYSAHAQATMVTESHDVFPSPYIGPNSLLPHDIAPTSLTATLFLDARLWQREGYSADLVFNPELAGGQGFSNVMGIAGFPNEEITRVGVPQPTPYIARLYLRQVWGLGGEQETMKDQLNQIAGKQDVDRFTLIVGKLPATDIADDNRYAHDARTQFLNWALTYNGAWDFPANVRGYTYGIALEYHTRDWTLNYGIFAEPEYANGAPLDPHFLKANGQVLELEERYQAGGRPGTVRVLGYLNLAHMGNYRQALAEMPVDPDVTQTRATRAKYGFGLNFDQEVSDDLGLFGRLGWDDGQEETWAFTEIDATASLGLVLRGTRWHRPGDRVGLAYVLNGLSDAHKDYLAAGGLGFIIGDGRLNYGLEQIMEMYYRFQILAGMGVGFDFQEIFNPAYNRDRGPVSVFSLVAHIEL
jgi:high affinity Mn2+ porin